MMRKTIVLILALLIINEYSGQNVSFTPTVDIYPKTPEAASLSKHVDIPPGSYTGVADFTIPIYTIDIDGEKIPIELQYTTTGIKVSEISSRVGLGWALNTGASLSQQVMGAMDKRPEKPVLSNINNLTEPCQKGLVYPFNDPCGIALSAVGLRSFAQEAVYDQLPDIYSYSLLNSSAQFIFDYSGTFGIPRPFNMTKIKPILDYGVKISAIEMTDDRGIFYSFRNHNLVGTIESISSCDPKIMPIEIDYQPNYKIEKILFPNNKQVTYTYNKNTHSQYVTSISEQDNIDRYWMPYDTISWPFDVLPPDRCVNSTQSMDRALTQINFDEGKILFYYNNDPKGFIENIRQDLNGEVYLTKVVVQDTNNHIVKDVSFIYDYFRSNDPIPDLYENYSFANSPDIFNRLKLTKVKDNLSLAEYNLSYYGEDENMSLPNRMSFSQDFWGVYNGKENNTPIPTVKTRKLVDEKVTVYIGADKQPDFDYGVIGNLRKIKYPTGGYTEITYEADDYKLFEDVGPVYGYQPEETELAYMGSNWVYFTISGASPVFNNSIELYDSESPPGVPIPVTGSTPRWELQRQNANGQYINFVGNSGHVGTGNIPREDEPGNYRLRVYKPVDFKDTRIVTAKYKWINEFIVTNSDVRKTGNIRIKQIVSNSVDAGKIIRKYSYLDSNTNQSSGINKGEEQFVALKYQEFDLPRTVQPLGPGRYMRYLSRTNNPGWQINTVRGKAVGYGSVQEVYESFLDPTKNYKKESIFKNDPSSTLYDPWNPINISWPLNELDRGLLQSEELFNNNGDSIQKTTFDYDYDFFFNNDATMNPNPGTNSSVIARGLEIQIKKINRTNSTIIGPVGYYFFNKADFSINNMWIKNVKTTTTDFINNTPSTITEKVIAYSNPPQHTFPTIQTLQNGNGEILNSQHFKYAIDKPNSYLIGKNMLSIPLETEVKKNGLTTISKVETTYPISQGDADNKTSGFPLPISVSSLDLNTGNLSTEILYKKYDLKGNILQYILKPDANENGIPVAIVWGYNQTLPIAKIDGATYDNLQNNPLILAMILASDADLSAIPGSDESALLLAEDNFRKDPGLANYQITTYSYDPLIGVRTVTPPSGHREFYVYDASGRLKEVKDINGVILKKNEYHYKP